MRDLHDKLLELVRRRIHQGVPFKGISISGGIGYRWHSEIKALVPTYDDKVDEWC